MNEVMTIKEYAQHQRCSAKLISSLIYKGEIPAYKLGREWRIPVGEADARLFKAGQERAQAIQERKQRRSEYANFDFSKALEQLRAERRQALCAIS